MQLARHAATILIINVFSAVILSVIFKYGCNETVSFCEKNEHEKSCLYALCSCPLPDFNFISSFKRLSRHFSHKHSHSATHFQYNSSFSVSLKFDDKFLVLQEEKNGILFVLNNYSQLYGNIVTVNCIGPCSSEGRFLYDLSQNQGFLSQIGICYGQHSKPSR